MRAKGGEMPGVVETEPIQYEVDGIANLAQPSAEELGQPATPAGLDEARIRAEEDDNIA
jgi:hypothetical protein